MKSKLFLTVLLLAAITTIGISQDKQRIKPTKDFIPDFIPDPVKPAKTLDELLDELVAERQTEMDELLAEGERIYKLPMKAQSLVGIKGIYVIVEPLQKSAKSAGLTEEQLKTDVELKLRLAGIKVNSREEYFVQYKKEGYGAPREGGALYVNVNTILYLTSLVYNCELKFQQEVRIQRVVGLFLDATTWDKGFVGICPKNEFPEVVRKYVKENVDYFINDYLTANPKK